MEFFIAVIALLLAHFISDFMLQTHYMSTKKSESISALTQHIVTYTLAFFIIFGTSWYFLYFFFGLGIPASIWLKITIGISIVNGIFHYFIDFVTSKITKYLWNKKQYHNFFVIIGLDQLLHTSLLVISLAQMLQNFKYIT